MIAYLRYRSCKYYHLVKLSHSLHELINTRPLDDVDIMELALNLDWYCKVGLMKNLNSLASRLLLVSFHQP